MKAISFFAAILAIAFGGTSAVAQTPAGAGANDNELYRIGFRDTIEVRVFKHPELSLRYGINPDGTIDLFRARAPLKAVCKTERELAAEITSEYVSFLKKPEVNVFAAEKNSQSYGVIGAVEKSGNYVVNRRIRLLELLSYAGGPNKEAGNRLIVARTGSSAACREEKAASDVADNFELMNFRLKDVLEAKQNVWMQPGDIVSVLDSDLVYVYGNVKKVGSVKMVEPITLTQAIVSAEGLQPTAKSEVRIIRRKGDSDERIELKFNLKDIEKQKVKDPYLEPDDIVAVSEDSLKSVLRGLTKTIQQSVPSALFRIP